MGDNPYRFADDGRNRILNLSGGRSSMYMGYHVLDAHEGTLPENVVAVFCNTGKERPETLDFVQRCAAEWSLPIVWLEYRYRPDAAGGMRDPKNTYEVVSHNSASRNGEPFEQLLEQKVMLPNVSMRFCTSELKVRAARRYTFYELGWRRMPLSVLGIRYDEPKRWEKALFEECHSEFPLVHARVDKPQVDRFWRGMPFDLGIPSALGNCDGCFLKGIGNLLHTFRLEPGRADWWIEQESKFEKKRTNSIKREMAQWSRRYTYAQLKQRAVDEPGLPFDEAEEIDCFCGD